MFFKQIYEPGLAHASYMVGCQKTGYCLVIDEKRDIDTYIYISRDDIPEPRPMMWMKPSSMP